MYDTDKDGLVEYRELAKEVFGAHEKKTETQKDSRAEDLVERLKRKLIERGPRGIMNLRKVFNSIDQGKSGKLRVDDFKVAIKELKLTIDSADLEVIFKHFDKDKDSLVSQQDVLNAIRDNMNETRTKLTNLVFDMLDKSKNGSIEIAEIKKKFNGNKHPAVLVGRKTEDQVVNELATSLDLYQECYGLKDNMLNHKEFLEYYQNISNCIDDDKYFEEMMVNCWSIDPANKPILPVEEPKEETKDEPKEKVKEDSKEESPSVNEEGKVKGEVSEVTTPSPTKPTEVQSITEAAREPSSAAQHFRNSIISRGPRSILGLRRQFKVYTKDEMLELGDFKKAVEDFRLKVSQEDLEEVFKELDRTNEGKVLFDEVMGVIMGKMSTRRWQFVVAAFKNIDKDNDGVVNKEDISRIFEGWKHKDAKSRKVRPDDVLNDVLETLNESTSSHRGVKCDGRYLREEFVKYFEYISVCTPNDSDFEHLFTTLWRVDINTLPQTVKIEKEEAISKVKEKVEEKTKEVAMGKEEKMSVKSSSTQEPSKVDTEGE
jgi:Ca2+-binding EF-hand superfamily protein